MKAIVLVFQGVVDSVAVVPDHVFEEVEAKLQGQPTFEEDGFVNVELWSEIKRKLEAHMVDNFLSIDCP
ncbi:MAG: hypothetical protein ACXQTR_00260 [Candidatus Methanospirareceae archaeon]